jgi:hypothetical protein
LLARVTVEPALGAEAVSAAVQVTCAQPVVVDGEQVMLLKVGVVAPKIVGGNMPMSKRTIRQK